MVVEYMILLLISTMMVTASFGLSNGPVKMFQDKAPYLGKLVEQRMQTGKGFVRTNEPWSRP